MKHKGVVYDVGLRFVEGGALSVEPFDSKLVQYDVNAIANDLSANAIRIEGEDIDRLFEAAHYAHASGLTVYFNPWKMSVPVEELPEYFKIAAKKAEKLRQDGLDIVFVCGCEITLFNKGIFPGNSLMDRIMWLAGVYQSPDSNEIFSEKSKLLNEILCKITHAVRSEFLGAVTYSSGSWEEVDWTQFDIVGVDYYRNGETAEEYTSGLEKYKLGKPLIVMEVGSCTYDGAAKMGAGGFMLLEGVNSDGTARFIDDKVPVRSEKEQADYVSEQLQLLEKNEVDGVFIYVFSFPIYTFGEGARDLDMMSFSLVKTYPDSDPRSKRLPPWDKKESFNRVKDFFNAH